MQGNVNNDDKNEGQDCDTLTRLDEKKPRDGNPKIGKEKDGTSIPDQKKIEGPQRCPAFAKKRRTRLERLEGAQGTESWRCVRGHSDSFGKLRDADAVRKGWEVVVLSGHIPAAVATQGPILLSGGCCDLSSGCCDLSGCCQQGPVYRRSAKQRARRNLGGRAHSGPVYGDGDR